MTRWKQDWDDNDPDREHVIQSRARLLEEQHKNRPNAWQSYPDSYDTGERGEEGLNQTFGGNFLPLNLDGRGDNGKDKLLRVICDDLVARNFKVDTKTAKKWPRWLLVRTDAKPSDIFVLSYLPPGAKIGRPLRWIWAEEFYAIAKIGDPANRGIENYYVDYDLTYPIRTLLNRSRFLS